MLLYKYKLRYLLTRISTSFTFIDAWQCYCTADRLYVYFVLFCFFPFFLISKNNYNSVRTAR